MKLYLIGTLVLLLTIVAQSPSVDAQEQRAQIKGPKDSTDQYSGTVYGPIDSNDTLWRIANRYRQNQNLSVYQVMVAIQELNPDAFENGNLNLLVNGAMLRLPSERYIARIDAELAQRRAEQDDNEWAQQVNAPGSSLKNIKPPVPLVNQADLNETKADLEQQLTNLDTEQTRQFEEVQRQLAASIENFEALLDENRKLFDRIDQVNTDLMNLKTEVEGDVKVQMDEQLALQKELLDLFKQEQQNQQTREQASIINKLNQPLVWAVLGTLLMIIIVVVAVMKVLRKGKTEPAEIAPQVAPAPQEMAPAPSTEMDDLSTAITDELDTAELDDDDLFSDDDLLDDVLSTELEDALDDDLETFAEISEDDMLVPEDDSSLFEEGGSELGQDDLDSLFDDDLVGDADIGNELDVALDDDLDGIDISGDETDLLDEMAQTSESELMEDVLDDSEIEDIAMASSEIDEQASDPADDIVDEDDIDALLAGNSGDTEAESLDDELSGAGITVPDVDDDDEKPEISIDDLLEANEEESRIPVEDGVVDDSMLDKLDEEITQQNQDLDKITDEIIQEIDQLEAMGITGEDDDFEEEIETAQPDGDAMGLQDIDAFADEIENVDIENAEDFDDPLSDDLIAELQAQDPVEHTDDDLAADIDELDALSSELLGELEADEAQNDSQNDALTNELLDELEASDESEEDSDFDKPQQEFDASEDLADELLAELENEIGEDDISSDTPLVDETDALADELLAELEDELEEDVALTEEAPIDDTDLLAQELLNELESLPDVEPEAVEDDIEFEFDEPDVEDAGDDELEYEVEEQPQDAADDLDDIEIEETHELDDDIVENELESDEAFELDQDVVEDELESAETFELDDDVVEDELESDETFELDDDVVEDGLESDETFELDEDVVEDDLESDETFELDEDVVEDDLESDETFELDEDVVEEQLESEETYALDDNPVEQDDPPMDEVFAGETSEDVDPLDAALDDFDKQIMDDIPAFGESENTQSDNDFDDSILDSAFDSVDDFALEQEVDGEVPQKTNQSRTEDNEVSELEDVPGLDDWLTTDSKPEDSAILDELDSQDFDELLESIEESETSSDEEKIEEALSLDNPDLDLQALLSDPDGDIEVDTDASTNEMEFVDVETLMNESLDADVPVLDDTPLDLDVSLAEFTGVGDDDDVIDIDKDAGQNTNLDLARAYIEMGDSEGAKDLLNDVLQNGTEEQKTEASTLMQKLKS